MNAYFEEMLKRLKLTVKQKEDAVTKYTNVSKLLHNEFYETDYNGSTKLLIGSYGKHTNIRPPEDNDLLFKIPESVYVQYEDSPGTLLQRIRNVLNETYTTTEEIHAWGKVVLIQFSDGTHNVELLPGFEIDGVFMIPNTEDGGSWESFDVRAEMQSIQDSNKLTNGITRKLIRIIKRWSKYTKTVTIKSYRIEELCVSFLSTYNLDGILWSVLVKDFFKWLGSVNDEDVTNNSTQINTAINRSTKAVQLNADGNTDDACKEWQKVFGKRTFPAASADLVKAFMLYLEQPSDKEMFIEDIVPVRINPATSISISAHFVGPKIPAHPFAAYIRGRSPVPKRQSIRFSAQITGVDNFDLKWKVRNFGDEAAIANGLRGEIKSGAGLILEENTLYEGMHYVECYVIKGGVCVARMIHWVPIGRV